jgi:hypothetical protein
VTDSVAVSVAAGIVAFLLLHVTIWRWAPDNSPRIVLLGLLAVAGLAVSAAADGMLGGNSLEVCAVLWIDAFLAVFYVIFYSALARSVSLTLLARMLSSGAQPLSVDALVREYASSPRFEDRIRVMHASGLAQLSPNSVRLTDKGARLARWAKALGRVAGGGLEG